MSISTLKPLVVVLGPTASGKSDLVLKLAKKYNGEIVDADSRQIYEEMSIGTGSPMQIKNKNIKIKKDNVRFKNKYIKLTIINGVAHHLFHFIRSNQQFSVSEYKNLAINIIRDIHGRGKLPILAGGTGLYISSVVDNLSIPKAPPSLKIRSSLEKKSASKLFNMLKKIDPKSASTIGPRNKRKIIRSLEVYMITGKPFSAHQVKGKPLFNVLEIGIIIDRDKLYKKIDQRVDKMIKSGLIEETKVLMNKYDANLPSMSGIGYKEIRQYLSSELDIKEATQMIKFRTHQYARRQMTWFRRDNRIKWIHGPTEAKKEIDKFLKNAKFK